MPKKGKSQKVKVKRKKMAKKPKKVFFKKKILKKKKTKKTAKTIKRKNQRKTKYKANSKKRKSASLKREKHKLQETFLGGSLFKAKIRVIGIGGGGSSIVSEIGRALRKASFVVADTDLRSFSKKSGIKNFAFGQKFTHGLGTGLNVELAKTSAEQEKEKIKKIFDGQDIVIFIASLGGGVGSGATEVFAKSVPQDFKGITFGIFTLPFKFEGQNKHKIAHSALKVLKNYLNVSIVIPNERIFKIIDENTPIIQAFSMVNKDLVESLESLIDLIYSPGIINIDFADLRTILSGMGNQAFLNTSQESGKNRVDNVIKNILNNPLYQSNNFDVQKILFNIAGGGNLSMFDVDKISRAISQRAPKAKIIFGISKNPQYKNKIKITLLMTGFSNDAKRAQAQEAIQKEVKKTYKKPKKQKVRQKNPPPKTVSSKKESFASPFIPVFSSSMQDNSFAKKINIIESQQNDKKIRRNALEIKKDQELEEAKKSKQEKEWEIPAFLRLKK